MKQTKLVLSATVKRDLQVESVSKTKKQILEAISRAVENAMEHFNGEVGGWKLDKDFLQSEILRDIFGFCIEDEIIQAFMNQGLSIEYSGNRSLVRTKEEYQPIYMNQRTGKIHLIENSDDKTYLNKFSSRKGYTEIGRL
jgi:hypothetical protein